MAVPNLKSGTLVVEPGRALLDLSVATYVDVIGAVGTGTAYFLEQILVSNKGAVTAAVTVSHKGGGTDYEIASGRTVQLKSVINVSQGRALILTEGDSLRAKIGAAGQNVHIDVPYTTAHE